MRIDDVFILFPELRPQPGVLQNLTRDQRKRVSRFHDADLELFGVRRLLVRGEVPVGLPDQILRRRTLLRSGPILTKTRRNEHQ